MGERELEQVLFEWNETEEKYPKDKCIQELFEEQVEKTPDAVAVVYEDEELTYGELNRRANRLAYHLRELGVGPDARVAICVERGLKMVVGLLGVLKAGGAYVPLDPSYPLERLKFMLKECSPAALLTQSHCRDRLGRLPEALPVLDLGDDKAWRGQRESNPAGGPTRLNAAQMAYVIFTSGSTGQPKGVMVQHGGVVNLIHDWTTRFRSTIQQDGIQASLWTSFGFDASVLELFAAFLLGGTVNIVPEHIKGDAQALLDWLIARGINYAYLPPFFIREMEEARFPASTLPLNFVLVGVEPFVESALHRFGLRGQRLQIVNGYGPTETTICSTTYVEIKDRFRNAPIGRPVGNTRIYVLDKRLKPVPVGVVGELYVAGEGVTRGYLNRPELTAEKFVCDPFSSEGAGRMYRTGDLGRWLPEGNIEFVGRNDYQVKIRGYRIELGEIESRLADYPGVIEAVVTVREDTVGDKRLVAYYTTGLSGDAEQEGLEAERLRSNLLASLPEYMVPAAYVRLESFPLTANGKLDRKALPAPDRNAYAMSGYEEPQGETETTVAAIWAERLKLERVGRQDNFFELGGHSLLATQVIARMRNVLQVEIPLQALFENRTLASLAAAIEKARTGETTGEQKRKLERIERQERSEGMPLSFHEQGIYVMTRHTPAYRSLASQIAIRLQGELNLGALEKSLQEIVERHEILRTRYGVKNGRDVRILDTAWEVRAAPTEIGGAEREEQVRQAVIREQTKPFDLERGPLLRINLLRLDEQEHVLLLTMHHIITDAWSMSILSRELQSLYAGHVAGRPVCLPALKIQYADYAVWQRDRLRGEVFNRLLGYWMKRLGGVKNLARLTGDRLPVVSPSLREEHVAFVIGKEATERIRDLSRKQGVTPFIILLAIFKLWLYQNTAAREIAVVVPVSERNLFELEDVVGLLINLVVLHAQVHEDHNFEDFLRRLHGVSQEAFAHQGLPFGIVHQALGNSDFGRIMFDYINAFDYELKLPGLKADPLYYRGNGSASWDVILVLREKSESIDCLLTFGADLFSKERVVELGEQLKNLIVQVLQAPQKRLGQYTQTPVYDYADLKA
jgi:amino acid adenylation domain-containing protein